MPRKKSKKKQMEEYEEQIQQAIIILGRVSEDTTTPRNIRRSAKQAIESLRHQDHTPAIRAANAVSILDDISQDPNMPPYTRVVLWQSVSILETIKD